jgi:hypothetical protein
LPKDEEYTIPFIASGGTAILMSDFPASTVPSMRSKAVQAFLTKPEKKDVSNKEIENLLNGLIQAFENSTSPNYGVKRAKTRISVTKSADGKLELGVGLGILKLVDAQGNLKGEWSQGIEIEIERKADH